jgi:hypothetical protein
MFEVVLYNSSRCELDRKQGEDLPALLRELADEGCLSGGDKIHIIDHEEDAARDAYVRAPGDPF